MSICWFEKINGIPPVGHQWATRGSSAGDDEAETIHSLTQGGDPSVNLPVFSRRESGLVFQCLSLGIVIRFPSLLAGPAGWAGVWLLGFASLWHNSPLASASASGRLVGVATCQVVYCRLLTCCRCTWWVPGGSLELTSGLGALPDGLRSRLAGL